MPESREQKLAIKYVDYHMNEIAARGGGYSIRPPGLQETSEDDLYEQSMVRIREIISLGTVLLEI
jgi:imidazolonepropionase